MNTAPVKVTNTATNAVLFEGGLNSGKTFSDLALNTVLKVEPGAVNGYTAPAAQTVTLDASKSITLEYKAAGEPLEPTRIKGQVTGTTLQLDEAFVGSVGDPFFGATKLTRNTVNLDLATLTPSMNDLSAGFLSGCKVERSAPDVRTLFNSSLNTYSPQGDLLGDIVETVVSGPDAQLGGAVLFRIYADRAATFKGTCTTQDGKTETIDLNLKAGWNTTVYGQSGNGFVMRMADPADRIQLLFIAEQPSVAVRLSTQPLVFSSNETVSTDVRFIQVGGYTGQVTLSTDVPGLTVEPATLSLPALPRLSAQSQTSSIQAMSQAPQLVNTKLTFRYTGGNYNGPFRLIVKDSAGKEVGSASGILNAQRPGVNLYASGYNLILRPGGTLNVDVTAQGVGGFTGDVTFSATDLPAGVTVTPVTKPLNGSVYVALPLQASAGVVPGTYKITLTADGGNGRTASTKVDITIPKPGVTLAVSEGYYGPVLYQGGTGAVTVNVASVNGFNGTTTISIENLPAGVTATPKTISVAPGTTTTVQIPLQATAEATLGSTTIQVTSPDRSADTSTGPGNSTTTLTVRPARISLGTGAGYAVRATDGVWVTNSGYDSATGPYTKISRFTMSGAATTGTLNTSSGQLIHSSEGVVVVQRLYGTSSAPILIKNDGTQTTLPNPNIQDAVFAPQADSQGRVWMVQRVSTSSGYTNMLAIWTPATGTVTAVQTLTSGYSAGQGRFFMSQDGTKAVYLGDEALLLDTVTNTATTLTLAQGAYSAAVTNSGTVWFNKSSELARMNADGTLTKYPISISTLAGFDAKDQNVLWGKADNPNNVARINTAAPTATGAVTSYELGSVMQVVTATGGGAYAITRGEFTGGAETWYLSYLK
ncbi:COG1470 family protein [Deinococcus arcticus]|uniref:COG1470 family protein n=1 Tax=Deinococcus arcticus TaxID=2136176 RepID=UPI0011B1CADD|nr:hypothetical protein [Deinococcus arcticus]